MIYYTSLIGFIVFVYFLIKILKIRKGKKVFFVLVTTSIIIFQGFRNYSVGTDLMGYIRGYLNIGSMPFLYLQYQNYEKGYVLLNKILYYVGLSDRQFLIVIALMIQIPIFYTIYKYSENYLISIFWYFSFGNFIMTFSGLRQSIAMSIIFSSYYFILKRQKLKYLLSIFLASVFHTSALFCLILYPVYYMKIKRKKFPLIFLGLVSLFLLNDKILILAGILYKGRIIEIEKTNAYTMLIIYLFIYVLSLIFNKKDREYQGLRNMLLLLEAIYLFAPIHFTFTRIGYPITLYMTLFIPKLLKQMKIKPRFIFLLLEILCFYCVVGSLNTLPFKFG